jgi:hypothetical protein
MRLLTSQLPDDNRHFEVKTNHSRLQHVDENAVNVTAPYMTKKPSVDVET